VRAGAQFALGRRTRAAQPQDGAEAGAAGAAVAPAGAGRAAPCSAPPGGARAREPGKAAATEGAARASPGPAGAALEAPGAPAGAAHGAGSEAAARAADASAMLAAMSPREARPAGPRPRVVPTTDKVLGLGGAVRAAAACAWGAAQSDRARQIAEARAEAEARLTPAQRAFLLRRGAARPQPAPRPDAGGPARASGGAGAEAGAARAAEAAGAPRAAPGAAAWLAGGARPGAAAGRDAGGRERGALAPRVRFALDGRAAGLAPAGGAGGEEVVLRDPLRCGPPTGPGALVAGGPPRARPGHGAAAGPGSGPLWERRMHMCPNPNLIFSPTAAPGGRGDAEAGYTLREAAALARSSLLGHRVAACRLLGAVLGRARATPADALRDALGGAARALEPPAGAAAPDVRPRTPAVPRHMR